MSESLSRQSRPCVLVFSGLDPSGGAGMVADVEAVGATGAHALSVITALTAQDNDKVYAVNPVDTEIIARQADVLIQKIPVASIKIGIVGNRANAEAIADIIRRLKQKQPDLPVVLDTVLGSGQGFSLTEGLPEYAWSPLIRLATLVTPNLPEAKRLYPESDDIAEQAKYLLSLGASDVLIKGGHGNDRNSVVNYLFSGSGSKQWKWTRIEGEFHGTGCTLASAIAGYLAQGMSMETAVEKGQELTQAALEKAFSIADGQKIPGRHIG